MNKYIRFAGVIYGLCLCNLTLGATLLPIDADLGGIKTPYTSYVLKLIKEWHSKPIVSKSENPVELECYETPDNPYYIGIKQTMTVHAPFQAVEAVMDDFNHYKDLFPDLKDVHVVSQEGNRILVFWEQLIPVFFLPNVKYESHYLLAKPSPNSKIYRYQLKESGKIKASDGVIVIESDGALTNYTEYDFFDAEWGMLKTLAPGKIWDDSVKGIYLSDVAIKLKSENPKWSYEQVREGSKKVLEAFSSEVEKAIEQKKAVP